MRGLLTLVLVFLMLAGPAAANGRTVFKDDVSERMVCGKVTVWTAQDASAPDAVKALMASSKPTSLVRTCEDARQTTHYFLREVDRNRGGICRLQENEMFLGTDRAVADKREWSRVMPLGWHQEGYTGNDVLVPVLAMLTDGACPPATDLRYVPTSNVTDGMLKQFDRLWRRITASPTALRRALKPLPVSRALPGYEEVLRERAVKAILEKPQVTSIDCYIDYTGSSCVARAGDFGFDFDVGAHGLALEEMGPLMHN